MALLTIDSTTYDVGIVKITRKARIDKKELGTTLDGTVHYGALGTYYDYEVTVDTKKMNVTAYDTLYEALTTPVNKHTCILPYGQSTLTGDFSISVANDSMVCNYTNFRRWSSLKITFEALKYAKVAE